MSKYMNGEASARRRLGVLRGIPKRLRNKWKRNPLLYKGRNMAILEVLNA